MKQKLRQILSVILCMVLFINMMPMQAFAVDDVPESISIDDGYLQVEVSTKNGGFLVNTLEGNRFIKSDDNKFLLYPDENFDTSFTSFKITKEGEEPKEYIFGREYGFLGIDTKDVKVEKTSDSQIKSTWEIDGVVIEQTLMLLSQSSEQHGMVSISYTISAPNNEAVEVEARVLMDTALGYQDYGIYELAHAEDGNTTSVSYESIFGDGVDAPYNNTFFAYDNMTSPRVTSYIVDGTFSSPEVSSKEFHPTKVAFGHWNNIASSVFEFNPDDEMNFTNNFNSDYLTADSAFALYYDLGEIAADSSVNFSTHYGVFSNIDKEIDSSVVMNFTSNSVTMRLNEEKTAYENAEFTMTTQTQNTSDEAIEKLIVAVLPQDGIDIIENGEVVTGKNIKEPYYVPLVNFGSFESMQTQSTTFNFEAHILERTQYRKIEFRVYRVEDMNNIIFSDDYLLSSEEIYVYCPTAVEPTVEFFGIEPQTVYSKGIRNVTISGTNFDLLQDTSRYGVTISNDTVSYDVPDSNITVSVGDNTLILNLDYEMIPGQYDIEFVYNDAGLELLPENGNKELPKIPLIVSAEPQFVPPNFGLVTVELVEGTGQDGNEEYEIKGYVDEKDYEKNSGEVYLTFRGQFDIKYELADEDDLESKYISRVEGISVKKTDQSPTNVITVNNSLDIENGALILRHDDGTVEIDIDADVYTSGARTSIWKGVCAITTFEKGTGYELTTYKVNGDELSPPQNIGYAKPITLIWPGAASYLQQVAGLAFEFRYGQFGELQLPNGDTRQVVSFGAKLDLGFLIPSNLKRDELQLTPLETAQYRLSTRQYSAHELRIVQMQYENDESLRAEAKGGAFGVYVNNILFGGEFIGFNADLEVGIPPYTEGLAEINGTLHIAIMNEYYEFGLKGSTSLLDEMKFSAEIAFKSHNMIPIPDRLSFAFEGLAPGIPLDPFGVIWLQGLGGGISEMYNSFFGDSDVPPLKLTLMGGVAIFSTLTGELRAAVSPRSVELAATGIGINGIDVIERMGVKFIWYPDIFISGELQVGILGIINGTGYIIYVSEQDLVEMFASVSLNLPEQIPIVGGMQIAHVDAGISNERVWGVAEAMKIGIGVVYYWADGDVQILTDTETLPTPSYGIASVPVAYDSLNDRTLMADFSSSVALAAEQNIVDDEALSNMSDSILSVASINSNTAKLEHEINLGSNNGKNGVLTLQFNATDLENAKYLANQITVDGDSNKLVFYDNNASAEANANANAKVSFNELSSKADVTITFTEDSDFNKEIVIMTPTGSDLTLYTVDEMPTVTDVEFDNDTNTVTWSGSRLDEYDSLTVFAEEKNPDSEEDSDPELYALGQTTSAGTGTITLDIPKTLNSGTYKIKIVALIDGVMNTTEYAIGQLTYENMDQPKAPEGIRATASGDYTIEVSGLPTDVDGYIVDVITADGSATDYVDVYVETSEDGTIRVGGRNTSLEPVETKVDNKTGETEVIYEEIETGLEAGVAYKVRVYTYNDLGEDGMIVSESAMTDEVTLEKPEEIILSESYNAPVTNVEYRRNDETFMIPTLNSNGFDMTVKVEGTDSFTGTWELLGQETAPTVVTGKSEISVSVVDLIDGMHTVNFVGKTAKGDNVNESIVFAVDTTAPVIQLASPTQGGLFDEDGTVMIEGYIDKESTLYVEIDGNIAKTYEIETDVLAEEITGLPSKDMVTLDIYAKDEVGNTSEAITLNLRNRGVSSMTVNSANNTKDTSYLGLFIGDVEYTNRPLPKHGENNNYEITPKIVSKDGTVIEITSEVTYSSDAIAGMILVDENGNASYDLDSRGVITASLYNGALEGSAVVSSETYSVTVVDSEGSGLYASGEEVTLTADVKEGYKFSRWTSPDIEIENPYDNPLTFTMPEKDITITANYSRISGSGGGGSSSAGDVEEEIINVFTDVMSTDYFYDAVLWAIEQGITNGTTETTFSPSDNSLRAQAITFIWRAMGSPKSVGENMFEDIAESEYYYEAVLWAVEQGITNGITETTFVPSGDITRGQFVTFLWRAAGMPKAIEEHQFTDVDKDIYYSDAISWAVDQGITNGMTETTFAADETCTRGQIVTFLYRYAMNQ